MRSQRSATHLLATLAWWVEWLSQIKKILRSGWERISRSRNSMNTFAVKRPSNSEKRSCPEFAIALIMFAEIRLPEVRATARAPRGA